MKKIYSLSCLMVFIVITSSFCQVGGKYIARTFESSTGGSLKYNIMYPLDFKESEVKKYPLLLFFHGSGERGDDNKAQLIHGSKLFKDSISRYPAIIVFPQCPKDDYWVKMKSSGSGKDRQMEIITDKGPNPAMSMVLEMVDELLEEDYIDASRFYVAGLSMGGMASIELSWRRADKVTATIAICGVGPTEKAELLKKIPFWFVHGIEDDVVPSRYSTSMLRAIQESGGKARITLYPGVGHNSWDNVFQDEEFFTFLFSKSKD